MRRVASRLLVLGAALMMPAAVFATGEACARPLYLTFDTGHMAVAPLIAEVLARQQVLATFFVADEKTMDGGTSLDDVWAPWWRARVAEGHAFASHTFEHAYWRGDTADGRFRIQASAGPQAGLPLLWSGAQYCDSLRRTAARFTSMTGARLLPLFRAPGGRHSPALLHSAQACGWKHVGWSDAGFLGDELPSNTYPNSVLLARALRSIRSGDILLAHLGIWSRKDPWAPAVLEPLIEGLKARGFCFRTLRDHPDYRGWIAASGGS